MSFVTKSYLGASLSFALISGVACSTSSEAANPSPPGIESESEEGQEPEGPVGEGLAEGGTHAPPAPDAAADAQREAEPPPARKRVFLSNIEGYGNLKAAEQAPNGFAGADKRCTEIAEGFGLGGTWKAFLSGMQNGKRINAIDRIADVAPWYLADRETLVFASKEELTGSPRHAIDMWANGKHAVRASAVWTGTNSGVLSGSTCQDANGNSWASGTGQGGTGRPYSIGEWSDGESFDCSLSGSLYCFEQ